MLVFGAACFVTNGLESLGKGERSLDRPHRNGTRGASGLPSRDAISFRCIEILRNESFLLGLALPIIFHSKHRETRRGFLF